MSTVFPRTFASAAKITLAAGILCSTISGMAQAVEVACVHDEAGLTQALADAQQNNATGKSDEIRLRVGHYDATAPEPDGWRIDLGNGTTSLAVLGGYTDDACLQRSMDPALTVLDGTSLDGATSIRPLTIDTNGSFGAPTGTEIVVSGLTFEDGKGDVAGALKISDGGPIYGGTILVERNIFRGNIATQKVDEDFYEFEGSAGALYAATDGPTGDQGGLGLIVRNNLFEANSGQNPAALFVFSNNEIAVTNNTFVGNIATQATLPDRLVFQVFSLWNIELSNNIFFANMPGDAAAFDVRAITSFFPGPERPITKLYSNVLQRVAGAPAHEEGTLAGDPLFLDAAGGDYRLAETSPAVDAGRSDPPGEIGSEDVHGEMRVRGTQVDIGAFERQPITVPVEIFLDGFE